MNAIYLLLLLILLCDNLYYATYCMAFLQQKYISKINKFDYISDYIGDRQTIIRVLDLIIYFYLLYNFVVTSFVDYNI